MNGENVVFQNEDLVLAMHGCQQFAARVNDEEGIVRLRYNFSTRMSSISIQLAEKLMLSMVPLHDPPNWISNSGYPFVSSVEGLFFLTQPLKVTLVGHSGTALQELVLNQVLVVPHLNNWCEIQINGQQPQCPNGPFAQLKDPDEIIHGTSSIFMEPELLEGMLRKLAREGTVCVTCHHPTGLTHKLKRCAGCSNPAIKYCSVECQRSHWPSHRPECRNIRV
jgi:hypothetical protein